MSEKKGWGSTVLGWFVVRDASDADSPETPPQEEAPPGDQAGTSAPAPPVFSSEPPAAKGGAVDFDGVFDAAGIGTGERALFSKAAGLLASLPEGTEPATRKAIVEASLKAFGVPIDTIIETGAHQIQTLEAYTRQQADGLRQFADDSQKLIADYERKIAEVKALLERRVSEQGALQSACNGKKLEVQKVLEFFGQEAVARVVRESPKLVVPAAGKG